MHYCASNSWIVTSVPYAKPSRELFTIGVLIAHDLFGVELCNLAIGVAESASQVSNRRSGSDHADCERVAQRMHLTRLQVIGTDVTERLGANGVPFIGPGVGHPQGRTCIQS